MTVPTGRNATSRREAMAIARQSRRPSRLGRKAGVTDKPDVVLDDDAGFPGLLTRAWQQAAAADHLPSALDSLLTLGGHVPADVSLRALTVSDECALTVLSRVPPPDDQARPAFLGELGLTRTGRVTLRGPSQPPLADTHELIADPKPVPWSDRAMSEYESELRLASARQADSVAECRAWLAAAGKTGRDELLEVLQDAALRTAPFILYQGRTQYTNFRDRNTLTGKTLSPGHPDCALSRLTGLPLAQWPDSDAVLVVCLTLLVRSGGYARIEEANGTELTVDRVAGLLERTRRLYNGVASLAGIAPATSGLDALNQLATTLKQRRTEIARTVRLYREIHGALLHKIERIAGAPGDLAREREASLCARLSRRLPITGDTLEELGAGLVAAPSWLCRPHGDFAHGLESLVYETVSAAVDTFDADFAMSRGMRSLSQLISALRKQDWSTITQWELPEYFCCVVTTPGARRHFGDSAERLADVAWAISSRMQYNSWHFVAGNLPKVPEVEARDYFVPPVIPDIAYYSDQHHRGHVAARVRFSIRSPQPVEILGRVFAGFVDLRLLRCEGTPFGEQDLLVAHRTSAFIARATTLAAALVADGADVEVEAFDSPWHWTTIGRI